MHKSTLTFLSLLFLLSGGLAISLSGQTTHTLHGRILDDQTGEADGQVKALIEQKNAVNIKNIVSSEQIAKFPDVSAADAIQRIPGITLQRDQGEGQYVQLRGTVNIVTKKATGEKPDINAMLAGGYNHLREKANYQLQFSYGQRYKGFGFYVNSSYYLNNQGSGQDNYYVQYKEFQLRHYTIQRERIWITATLDYQFNPASSVYVRGMFNNFKDNEYRRRVVYDLDLLLFQKIVVRDQNITAKLNYQIPYLNRPNSNGYIQFGGKMRFKKKDRDNQAMDYGAYRQTSLTYPGTGPKLSLNYHNAFLYSLGADSDLDEYYDKELHLDFNANYQITRYLNVFVEAINLTNAPLRYYLGEPDRILKQEFYSWWGRIGIKLSF